MPEENRTPGAIQEYILRLTDDQVAVLMELPDDGQIFEILQNIVVPNEAVETAANLTINQNENATDQTELGPTQEHTDFNPVIDLSGRSSPTSDL